MPLKALCFLSVLLLSLTSPPSGALQTSEDSRLEKAKQATGDGAVSATVLRLQDELSSSTSALELDRISRAFEAIGWYRDAQIASERVANLSDADPHLRALHANRSRLLQPKVEKAFVRVTGTDAWSRIWINGSLVKDVSSEVEVDPSDGAAVIELLSSDGTDLAVFWVEAKKARRIDLAASKPGSRDYAIYLTERYQKLRLKEYDVRSSLEKLKRLHLVPGRVSAKVTIDERVPVTLELQGQLGQQLVLRKDIDAAKVLRDLKVDKEMSIRSQAGPYITIAAGALTAGVGLVFYAAAKNDRNRIDTGTNLPTAEAESLTQSARTKESTAGILLGLGATATVSGVIWYVINVVRGRKEGQTLERALNRLPQPSTAGLRF